MRVRILGRRLTLNIGVRGLGPVEFVNGMANIRDGAFENVAEALAGIGLTLVNVKAKKSPAKKKQKKEQAAPTAEAS